MLGTESTDDLPVARLCIPRDRQRPGSPISDGEKVKVAGDDPAMPETHALVYLSGLKVPVSRLKANLRYVVA